MIDEFARVSDVLSAEAERRSVEAALLVRLASTGAAAGAGVIDK